MSEKLKGDAIQKIFKLILERKEGYQRASQFVEDDELSELFESYVKQCEDFALELAPYDLNIEKNILKTSPSASSKKNWTEVKQSNLSGGTKDILDSCMSGEQAVLTKYMEIIEKESFNEELFNVVDQQREKIEEAVENIKIQLNTL